MSGVGSAALSNIIEDPVIKSDLYDQILEDGFKPTIVFEDRESVVKMWRGRGLRCLQVAEGNF